MLSVSKKKIIIYTFKNENVRAYDIQFNYTKKKKK